MCNGFSKSEQLLWEKFQKRFPIAIRRLELAVYQTGFSGGFDVSLGIRTSQTGKQLRQLFRHKLANVVCGKAFNATLKFSQDDVLYHIAAMRQ